MNRALTTFLFREHHIPIPTMRLAATQTRVLLMAAAEEEKAEEKGVSAAEKGQIRVDLEDEEKGARVVEKGEMGVKAAYEDKGVTVKGKTIETAVEKGEEDSTVVSEEEGETAEGKGKGKGKKREPTAIEKDPTTDWDLEWKWNVKTVADGEEGSNTRREPRRWCRMRRDQSVAVEKGKEEDQKDKTTAIEEAGKKRIFLFSADAATRKMITQDVGGGGTTIGGPRRHIDNNCANGNIPLSEVDNRALNTVIKYCDKHAAAELGAMDEGGSSSSANTMASKNKKAMDEWDHKLVRDLTQDALFDLIIAANFLDIKGLLDACCQKVVDMIKNKTPAQIRATFKIANDLTVEDEEEIRNEYPWVFDEEEDEEDA